ncbi:hypothetical protein ALC56_10746, partial [Trachymyrmex septentrionalis]
NGRCRDLFVSLWRSTASWLVENPQLYPFPSAIIPSFSDNERSRGENAICRDDGRGEENVKADTGSSTRLIAWLRARKEVMSVYPLIGLRN